MWTLQYYTVMTEEVFRSFLTSDQLLRYDVVAMQKPMGGRGIGARGAGSLMTF